MSDQSFWRKMLRKKAIDTEETRLAKSLTTGNLCLMNVAAMIGGGVYVITGEVAAEYAGPSVVLSYLIAGVGALLSALCYAEMTTKLPKPGSTIEFIYVLWGEVFAFLLGTTVIFSSIVISAYLANEFANVLDALFDYAVSTYLEALTSTWWPQSDYTTSYPNVIGVVFVIVAFLLSFCRISTSTAISNTVTCFNICALAICCGVGFANANITNWNDWFTGGYEGVLKGAALCSLALFGYETTSLLSAEAVNPQKTVPRALIASVTSVTALYMLAAAALTLMVPSTDISSDTPFQSAFTEVGVAWANYAVSIAETICFTTVTISGFIGGSRYMYSIADDGLLPAWFGEIDTRTQTPSNALAFIAAATALSTLILTTDFLVDMGTMSVNVLYLSVPITVLMIRYNDEVPFEVTGKSEPFKEVAGHLPRPLTFIILIVLFSIISTVCFWYGGTHNIFIAGFFLLLEAVNCLGLSLYGQNQFADDGFRLPFVPAVPIAAIYFDMVLIFSFKWYILLEWLALMAAAALFYVAYGQSHSKLNRPTYDQITNEVANEVPPEN